MPKPEKPFKTAPLDGYIIKEIIERERQERDRKRREEEQPRKEAPENSPKPTPETPPHKDTFDITPPSIKTPDDNTWDI